MVNKQNAYITAQIKSSLTNMHVILTNGNKRHANLAIISNVEVIENINNLILQIAGNMKESLDGIYINVEGVFLKLSFKIIPMEISKDILQSYIYCYDGKIKHSYELFEFCRYKNKVKQVRQSTTGGTFLEWYGNGRVTNSSITSFDGIWISGRYIRVLPVVPPSLEYSVSEALFEKFNDSKPFTSVGSYQVYVPGTSLTSGDSYYEEYTAINGIVIPNIKAFKTITTERIEAIDRYDNEFVIYSNRKKEEEEKENIA